MILLLGRIAMEHLYLHSWQIVGHNVARHIDGFGRKVVNFLNGACPLHLVCVWKLIYLWLMDIP